MAILVVASRARSCVSPVEQQHVLLIAGKVQEIDLRKEPTQHNPIESVLTVAEIYAVLIFVPDRIELIVQEMGQARGGELIGQERLLLLLLGAPGVGYLLYICSKNGR